MGQIRTSKSHPLRIDELVMPEPYGRVGMTLCPGKQGRSAFGYRWQRDIDTDIQKILDWKADIIVILMELDELHRYKVGTLEELCEEKGLEVHHLPIRDVDIPGQHFERLWSYSGVRLRHALVNGKNILTHCRGGLGRTGTIVARLLIELGMPPQMAIQTIRERRPGAIETLQQENYAESCRPVPNQEDKHIDRVLGCLFGGAIGDGLGYLVEFDGIEEIREHYGERGIVSPVAGGVITVSDDTQMTLFTMEGLLRAKGYSMGSRVEEVRSAYLDWLCTQIGNLNKDIIKGELAFSPGLQIQRAPGNTCLGALERGGNGQPQTPINDSKGCGSVMRVAPVGLLSGDLESSDIFELGMRTGALTHGHMTSSLAAGGMAVMVSRLMKGDPLNIAAQVALAMVKKFPDHEEVSIAMSKAIDFSKKDTDDHSNVINKLWGDNNLRDNTSRGWIAEEALAIGLYGALKGNSFSEAITIAANHNGDSDSTASVAGQLYGAWRGIDGIPHNWIVKIDVFRDIVRLVEEMIPRNDTERKV